MPKIDHLWLPHSLQNILIKVEGIADSHKTVLLFIILEIVVFDTLNTIDNNSFLKPLKTRNLLNSAHQRNVFYKNYIKSQIHLKLKYTEFMVKK